LIALPGNGTYKCERRATAREVVEFLKNANCDGYMWVEWGKPEKGEFGEIPLECQTSAELCMPSGACNCQIR